MKKMKNIIYRISVLCVAFVSVLACVPQQSVDFDLDTDLIEIGPEGGVKMTTGLQQYRNHGLQYLLQTELDR